ncbi:SDR family NAD(P)-dependent oxidoreductase [Ralstonia flaminis]|jgi:2-deoxy-D-gluconate 3-dehydrogenase|uniref:2-dehydro-3-deoxy-D-gluconate 5-dehydrogenase n=1 Tax=Ralstonia flaminis TaxID=3058597 RepID=A0ABM9K479_9RALS|nr:glucose 1-dehydrogenase [Ralstonia sp. LMG 18101]CAJ0812607.1 2-dehydro-3-deoxy-D-gluconate 5-dehydrogenase [Ralstonia sp. LMG 18101]
MQLFDLRGRVAIVTGGNGGIGLGIATGLAQAGAAIAIVGRDVAKNQTAAGQLVAAGFNARFVSADITNPGACQAMVQTVAAHFGRVDILVNNAGMTIRKLAQDYTPQDWQRVMDVNVSGTFHCAQAVFPEFQKAGGGKIINIGSMMSIFGATYAAPYSASKGAIVQLTQALAVEWATHRIQVNAILPGWIDTELTQSGRAEFPDYDYEGAVLGRTPAGRWGEPTDLAGAAVFLASQASDFVTGTAIPVDGGYSAQG